MLDQTPTVHVPKSCSECHSKLHNIQGQLVCVECDHKVSATGEITKPTPAQKENPALTLEMLRRKLFVDTFEAIDAASNPAQRAYETIIECESLILEYATKLGEAKTKHAAASKYLYVDEQQRTEVSRRIESREYELTHGRQRTQVEIDEAKRTKTTKPQDAIRKHIVDMLRLVKAAGSKDIPAPEKLHAVLMASKKYPAGILTVPLVEALLKDVISKGGK